MRLNENALGKLFYGLGAGFFSLAAFALPVMGDENAQPIQMSEGWIGVSGFPVAFSPLAYLQGDKLHAVNSSFSSDEDKTNFSIKMGSNIWSYAGIQLPLEWSCLDRNGAPRAKVLQLDHPSDPPTTSPAEKAGPFDCVTNGLVSAGKVKLIANFVDVTPDDPESSNIQQVMDLAKIRFDAEETNVITRPPRSRQGWNPPEMQFGVSQTLPHPEHPGNLDATGVLFPEEVVRHQTVFEKQHVLSAFVPSTGVRLVYIFLDRRYAGKNACETAVFMEGWFAISKNARPRLLGLDADIDDCDRGAKDSSPVGLFSVDQRTYALVHENFYEDGGFSSLEVNAAGNLEPSFDFGDTSYLEFKP